MIRYYIWLQCALGQGNPKVVRIMEHFGSAEAVFKASGEERTKSRLFSTKELVRMESVSLTNSLEIMARCREEGIDVIPFGDDRYPLCLANISDPPLVIYVKGKLPDFDNTPAVTIVGPRKVSEFGKKAAYSLGYRLAASGVTVVSGGALGTDTYAHAGALKAGGKTALCLGCGICSDYLKENEKLRNAVLKNGCLISEYPPDSEASRYTFPIRNRIMSALGLGTIVIEAGVKSGSLITARHANEQGRDVFVIPGSPDDKKYMGSNSLLRDGAKPLLDVSDIFNEYIPQFPDKINIDNAYNKPIIDKKEKAETKVETKAFEKKEKNLIKTLSKEAKIVYNYLDKQIFLPEEINAPELSGSQLLAALTELEMEFLIEALPGGRYKIV